MIDTFLLFIWCFDEKCWGMPVSFQGISKARKAFDQIIADNPIRISLKLVALESETTIALYSYDPAIKCESCGQIINN